MSRRAWNWRDTTRLRMLLPGLLREPLTATALHRRMLTIADVNARRRWRAIEWCLGVGLIRKVPGPGKRALYVRGA